MRHSLPAALITSLFLGGVAAAQDAPVAANPARFEAVIAQLALTDVEIHEGRHRGAKVQGVLPDGSWVEIDFTRDHAVEEVETSGQAGFPASSVESLVPVTVRSNPAYPRDASFRKIEFDDDGGVEVEGLNAQGREFDAEFAPDGHLVEMDVEG